MKYPPSGYLSQPRSWTWLWQETLVLRKDLVNIFVNFLFTHDAYSLTIAQFDLLTLDNLARSSFSDGVMTTFQELHDKPWNLALVACLPHLALKGRWGASWVSAGFGSQTQPSGFVSPDPVNANGDENNENKFTAREDAQVKDDDKATGQLEQWDQGEIGSQPQWDQVRISDLLPICWVASGSSCNLSVPQSPYL